MRNLISFLNAKMGQIFHFKIFILKNYKELSDF